MGVLGVSFNFLGGSNVFGRSMICSFEGGQGDGQKEVYSPDELKDMADQLLHEHGCTKNGQKKQSGSKAIEAFKQSRFEGRMWNAGFRGASRKNR